MTPLSRDDDTKDTWILVYATMRITLVPRVPYSWGCLIETASDVHQARGTANASFMAFGTIDEWKGLDHRLMQLMVHGVGLRGSWVQKLWPHPPPRVSILFLEYFIARQPSHRNTVNARTARHFALGEYANIAKHYWVSRRLSCRLIWSNITPHLTYAWERFLRIVHPPTRFLGSSTWPAWLFLISMKATRILPFPSRRPYFLKTAVLPSSTFTAKSWTWMIINTLLLPP
jgi:hypothetical protein